MERSSSVSSVNLDESVTETGITIDDIATFISGPDALDGKWMCLFPECKKRFGRKENIKSHVQTHLGDRQFQCPHCRKCFVRQHDLKRHAKIHSGVKPYPCACGNSFARHDALTRHRQRGMCIGAFEGVVKKVVKRGRPKKSRPDDEDRLAKSSRTRSKVASSVAASSASEYSESSYGHSPSASFDMADDAFAPAVDFSRSTNEFLAAKEFQYMQASSPISNSCVSPHAITSTHSPSAYSTHSPYPAHSSQHYPSQPSSPAKSIASLYNAPLPELCDSSSPVPSHENQYYDFEAEDQGRGAGGESFMDAFAGIQDGGLGLGLMGMGKFEQGFAEDELFQGGDDVFFGSP